MFHHPPSRSLYPVLPPHPPFFFFFFLVLPFPAECGSEGKGRGSREGQGWLLLRQTLLLLLPRLSPRRGSPLESATCAESWSQGHTNSFPGAQRGRAGGAGAGQPRAASRGPRSPEPGMRLISSPAGPGSCEHVGASSRGPGLRAAAASSVLYLLRLPESEQGSGALQTRTLTHAHTRASSGQSQPCHRRARTPGERGRRLKEKKERGGGESQAAAAAAARAEATTSTGKAGSGSGSAHQDQRQHLHPSSWELGRAVPGEQTTRRRAESRSERGRAGAVQPACGGRSRGPSRGQNEPRAGELRERRKPGRGLAPEKGVAGGKTRIWSALGLRCAGST